MGNNAVSAVVMKASPTIAAVEREGASGDDFNYNDAIESVRQAEEERHSPATSRSPRRGRRRERTPAWPTTRNGEKRRSPSLDLLKVVSIVDSHHSGPSEHRAREV